MKISTAFLRVFFVILSLVFMTAFTVSLVDGTLWQKILLGMGLTALLNGFLIGLELLFKRYNLKAFNTMILGLFIGYLMGQALVVICTALLNLSHPHGLVHSETLQWLKISLFLAGTYLGTFLTIHFSDEFRISIPFVQLSSVSLRKKDLLLDPFSLSDSRIIDLAMTGLLDNSLLIPESILKELYLQAELENDLAKNKAKRCIETFKKLESIPHLGMRYESTTLSDLSDPLNQLIRLAKLTDSNILTADVSQVQIPSVEGIKIINLYCLSNALKPLMQTGELLKIKIQRFGKEPNQGVGYLEDGTMVVINGGGDFIGESIDAQVLSIKHTSSGRMIFCNTLDYVPAKGNRVDE